MESMIKHTPSNDAATQESEQHGTAYIYGNHIVWVSEDQVP